MLDSVPHIQSVQEFGSGMSLPGQELDYPQI